MPPIFKEQIIKGYVNPFFSSSEEMMRDVRGEPNPIFVREIKGVWVLKDHPHPTTFDGVLAELKKQHVKKRKLRKKKK